MRQDLLRPVFFSLVLKSICVHFGVDFLEQFQADDAVVGCFVERDTGCADVGLLRVDVVDALGIEDFVYTGEMTRQPLFFFLVILDDEGTIGLTKVSRRSDEEQSRA